MHCLRLCLCLCLLTALSVSVFAQTKQPCGANETYFECGANCDTECATLGQPCLINYIRCPDGCYCNKGFARNAKNQCVKVETCRRTIID